MRKSSWLWIAVCALSLVVHPRTAAADDLSDIEARLTAFVNALQVTPPQTATLGDRVRTYVERCPTACYGSTVTMLDAAGKAVASPYWFRRAGRLEYADLMSADYRIDDQDWLKAPLKAGLPVWTAPYFDKGGGEVWMRTLSMPVFSNGKIIAIATTDLKVSEPGPAR